jgi:hypothetical protein
VDEAYLDNLAKMPGIEHQRLTHGTFQSESSDRGMSLPQWQDWIVDLLIRKHDEGLSDNQLRMIFATEFDRRYGNGIKKG